MRVKFDEYNYGHRIVSLALDEVTKNDLCKSNVGLLYVQKDFIKIYPEDIVISENKNVISKLRTNYNYDIFELLDNGMAISIYKNNSLDNSFFITGKCNSNCLMCPSPEDSRRYGINTPVSNLIEIARHIPINVKHLTITGGEPFMIGKGIFEFFRYLKYKFTHTEFLLLTNGRIFL